MNTWYCFEEVPVCVDAVAKISLFCYLCVWMCIIENSFLIDQSVILYSVFLCTREFIFGLFLIFAFPPTYHIPVIFFLILLVTAWVWWEWSRSLSWSARKAAWSWTFGPSWWLEPGEWWEEWWWGERRWRYSWKSLYGFPDESQVEIVEEESDNELFFSIKRREMVVEFCITRSCNFSSAYQNIRLEVNITAFFFTCL